MSENPFEPLLKTLDTISRCVQTHLSRVFVAPQNASPRPTLLRPLLSFSPTPVAPDSTTSPIKEKKAAPLTKEELGRATWTLLHSIAAQCEQLYGVEISAETNDNSQNILEYPDHPTRQQKRDVKELMAIVSRLYPCKECADHFKEVLKANPVQAGSQAEFSQWLCHVHNVVNRSLGKVIFPCQRVDARWGKLDCKDRSCDLEGTLDIKTLTTHT